jgi:serine/threonine protein kinase
MLTEKEKRSLVGAVDGEYSIMKRISHPYITKVLKYHRSATKGEDKCMMVLELAPHGDLQDFTNKMVDNEMTYPEPVIRKLLQ